MTNDEQNYAETDYAQPDTPFKGISRLKTFTQMLCYEMEYVCKPVNLYRYEQITARLELLYRGIGCAL